MPRTRPGRRAWRGPSFALALALTLPAAGARAETTASRPEIDLALVLAVDISFSMDPDEQALQRQGFVDAFRSVNVKDAIGHGLIGRIAVTYVEWAGSTDQRVVVPWTFVDTPASADDFADTLTAHPTRRAARTSISGALDYATKLLDEGPFTATRQVIDVSGDGPNNQGRPVTAARADALAHGITINGLPIMLKAPGYFDIADLDIYYRDCVIGGQGAFMVPVRERDQFREVVRTKVIMEVADAGRPPASAHADAATGHARILLVQTEAPRGNCFAGEIQWRDRMGN